MPFVKVGSTGELPTDSMREVTVGENCYALCNVEGEVYAMAGLCLHRGGPLAEGALHGPKVVCPWHAWEWDCRTGANEYNPDQKTATYAVKLEGEDILIDIP
jgi:nitrite reductase (NADH) small subunit